MSFKLFDELRQNEVTYMVKMGWLEAGVAPGTYKLTAAGITEINRQIDAMDAKTKLMVKLQVGGNVEADPATLI